MVSLHMLVLLKCKFMFYVISTYYDGVVAEFCLLLLWWLLQMQVSCHKKKLCVLVSGIPIYGD